MGYCWAWGWGPFDIDIFFILYLIFLIRPLYYKASRLDWNHTLLYYTNTNMNAWSKILDSSLVEFKLNLISFEWSINILWYWVLISLKGLEWVCKKRGGSCTNWEQINADKRIKLGWGLGWKFTFLGGKERIDTINFYGLKPACVIFHNSTVCFYTSHPPSTLCCSISSANIGKLIINNNCSFWSENLWGFCRFWY